MFVKSLVEQGPILTDASNHSLTMILLTSRIFLLNIKISLSQLQREILDLIFTSIKQELTSLKKIELHRCETVRMRRESRLQH